MNNTTQKGASKDEPTPSNTELWYAAYVIVAVAIVIGNILTIVIFTRRRHKNMLLISLAIADLIIGLVAVPMYIYLLHISFYELTWKEHAFLRVYLTVDVFVGLGSIFALTLIACERVCAIFWPFEFRCIATRTYWILIGHGWMLAAFLAIIRLFALEDLIPREVAKHSLLLFALVSLVTIVAAYISVLIKIKKAKRRGAINAIFAEEKHISLALLTVTLVFLITWLPFYLLNLIGGFKTSIFEHIPHEVTYVAKLLQYGNSFMNPVIYSLTFPEFRATLKNMMRKRRFSQGIVANEVAYRFNSTL